MDSVGTLELSWAQGFNESEVHYIDKTVVCYQVGNYIKFIKDDGDETVFAFTGDGVGPMAVHALDKCFAVSEKCINPKICVYIYPTFRELTVLEGGAKLEFTKLAFSSSDYLASVSGVPDFELTLWNFQKGEKLTSVQLLSDPPTSVAFNPADWRQICVIGETFLRVWSVEQSDTTYLLQDKNLKLPADDPITWKDEEDWERNQAIPTRASTRMSRYTVDVPKAAKAGLIGPMAEHLDEIQDETTRVVPMSVCWNQKGDIYVGCKGGQLVKVDGETLRVKVLYFPPPKTSLPPSRSESAISQPGKKTSFLDATVLGDDLSDMIIEGGLNCLAVHRKGLYAAGEDGVVRLLSTAGDDLKVIEKCLVGVPISSLSFSMSYANLAIGTRQGTIYSYEAGSADSLKPIKSSHFGKFVGVGVIAQGNDHCVSVREDGEIQVWTMDRGRLISSLSIGFEASAFACSPLHQTCAVGTVSGSLYYVDLSNVKEPRIIHRTRLYNGPILHLVYDDDGRYLLTGSNDGNLFIINGKVSNKLPVVAHTAIEGEIRSIGLHAEGQAVKFVIMSNTITSRPLGANKLTSFEIPDNFLKDIKKFLSSLKCDLKPEAIKKMNVGLGNLSNGVALTTRTNVLTIGQNNKKILQYTLPDELPKKNADKVRILPDSDFEGHQLPGGSVCLSPHHKWMASYGPDGTVQIRSIESLDRFISMKPHDYNSGGVKCVGFSDDCRYIFTIGYDGALACYEWKFSSTGTGKAKSAMEAARAKRTKLMHIQQEENKALKAMPDWNPPSLTERSSSPTDTSTKEMSEKEKAVANDEIYRTPTPVSGEDDTWLEMQKTEALKNEEKQYADQKKKLRVEIRDMRRTIQGMMKQNEELPDIDQLGRHEFDLDVDEQNRLQAEGDAEVQRIREEIEFENLAKMYLKEMIKKECWDEMKIKGRAIQGFNYSLEVSNFPMKERPENIKQLVDRISRRRKIEVQELVARKAEMDQLHKPTPAADDDNAEGEEGDDESEQPSTTGSLGALYGGQNDLYHSQFELHTREQKISQIMLLQDAIHKIKTLFNKDFDEVFQKKEQEIARIKDKNKRITKIMADLDVNEPVVEPVISSAERPENLLTVDDSEVKIEKYLTPEERKKVEEQEKVEEERRLREKGDNARERGLEMMMGGVLEVKKEDELKKDIPVPMFMSAKAESDWSEEEQKIAKDYERRVKELQEEREKYRKQLETELRKLQSIISDGMTNFDDFLNQLFLKKIKVMMVIYQEELKILRLRYALLMEEELEIREKELNRLVEHKKQLKQASTQAVEISKKHVDAYREQYDILVAEDRYMDKSFKREFNDVTALQADQLYRLFRRRPRIQRMKGVDGTGTESSVPNPFAERPSTARQNTVAKTSLEAAMAEMDKESNMPESLIPVYWEKFCKYRREKIDREQLVKKSALVLAEMQSFLQKRLEDDETLKNEIDDIMTLLNKLKEDKLRFTLNLEVQLLLKQGQVEVDCGQFIHDYRDSVLIHRSGVQDLNSTIKQLGESKIASMVESKDFRKGIIQLEWEHKKMLMQMEDFQNKMKDIQFMKVTREIQAYLNEKDYDGKKSQEIATLEQTIVQRKKQHEKAVDTRRKTMKELQKVVKQKSADNSAIDQELKELNVSVNERGHIDEVNAEKRTDTGADERYHEIVQRRKLVDLAKAQAQEVAVLRAEVERLRMRTFPALVQVEH